MNLKPRHGSRAIVVKDDSILLIHRLKSGREYYVLPGGGIEPDESSEEAVLREVREETEIIIKPEKIIYELIQADGAKIDFWLCRYIEGQPFLSPSSVEKEKESEQNQYLPIWLGLEKINQINLLPVLIKNSLIQDINDKVFVFRKIFEK